jgi:hypothetical protein
VGADQDHHGRNDREDEHDREGARESEHECSILRHCPVD